MDLVTILKGNVKSGDVMDLERKQILARALNRMNHLQANTAFSLIRNYKLKYDNVRRVGDSDGSIPYYGTQLADGIEFSIETLPEPLLLILEQLVISGN